MPGTTGTFEAIAIARAVVLSANASRFATVGPMNVMPFASHARASSADFGERERDTERETGKAAARATRRIASEWGEALRHSCFFVVTI